MNLPQPPFRHNLKVLGTLAVSLSLLMWIPSIVLAQDGRVVLPGSKATSPATGIFDPNMSLSQFFNVAFKTALVIGAMLAVARLIYAGFIYMTTDLPGMKGDAKGIIGETMTGLLLLLAVALILNLINPQILNLDILQGVKNSPSTIGPSTNSQVSGVFTPTPKETKSKTPVIVADPPIAPPKPTPPPQVTCTPPEVYNSKTGGCFIPAKSQP